MDHTSFDALKPGGLLVAFTLPHGDLAALYSDWLNRLKLALRKG